MAKGKYKARARLSQQSRAEANAVAQAARLARERELLRESEKEVAELDALLGEIRTLKDEHAARHRGDEERLTAEIEVLLAELAEVSERSRAARKEREKWMVSGSGLTFMEKALREVEKRLVERYPDEVIPPPTSLVIIDGEHQRGLPSEVIRKIQRAQRSRCRMIPFVDANTRAVFIYELGISGNVAFACEAAGLTLTEVTDERRQQPEFEHAWRMAQARARRDYRSRHTK